MTFYFFNLNYSTEKKEEGEKALNINKNNK
jgi:hypothetical protein